MVLDLKAKLQKVKDATRVARNASEATETASYERGVQETKTWLAGVCRNYCTEVWAKALNQAGVPADSELRSAENIFFLEDSREVPAMLPPPVVDPLPPPKQLSTIQAPFPNTEVSIGADKGKEVQPPIKANHSEDTLTIKDVVSKAKDAESKSKAGIPNLR